MSAVHMPGIKQRMNEVLKKRKGVFTGGYTPSSLVSKLVPA